MDKQYLISFLATLRGEKMVTQGLTKIEQKTQRVGKTTDRTKKSTESYSQAMGRLTKRALLTIPVWLLLRQAFMGIIRLIGSMVSGYLELEDGLARIQTVVLGTTEEVESHMRTIKNVIKDTAVKTRVPLKELAETFYYLRTSSLTTAEAMSAFEHTVDAMTGTGIKGKEMARAVAGVYNTMGKYILKGASASEKFQKITDVLTYTYATQDVQMDELVQGYTKMAPYMSGLSDSFTDLVTVIGYLNTRMLRAGRTGRLTGRTILQISKNASKLASIFGITFDPNLPINFLGTMEKINAVMKRQGKLTFEQSQALQQVFATRGAIAPRLLLESFEGLREEIERANEEAEGFAKRMAEIKMDTVRGQMERMSNITKILFEDFVSAYYATGDMASALDKMNDALVEIRPVAQAVGDIFGWMSYNLAQLAIQYELMGKAVEKQNIWERMIPGYNLIKWTKDYRKMMTEAGIKYKTPTQYIEDLTKKEQKLGEIRKKQEIERLELQQEEQEGQEDLLAGEKLRQEELKNEIALMKILGATGIEIARFRLESLEMERAFMTDADYRVQQQIRLNALIQEETKGKEEVRKVMQNLYIDYMKAEQAQDREAKEGVRSLMEALTLTPEQMTIWWRTATDKWRDMILENFDLLTEGQQEALKEYWEATRQFPDVEIFSPVTRLKKQIGEEIPTTFWENWIEKMTSATDKFRERFLGVVEEPTVRGEGAKAIPAEEQFVADWKKYYKERGMEWGAEEEGGFRKAGKKIYPEEAPPVTEITINISRIDAKGVTKEEVENVIPGALAKAIEREEIIKKIRRKV